MDDDELFTAQMVRLTPMLFETLAGAGGDAMIAAQSPQLLQAWARTEQQTRAALLLSLAWHARTRESVDGETTPQQYAGALQKFATDHTGDLDSFHGENYPAAPLPGRAGDLADTYTTDDNNVDLSLETALILLNAQSPAPAPTDEPLVPPASHPAGVRTGADQAQPEG